MAVPSSSYALTPLELAEFDGWSFIISYNKNKNHEDLLDLAKSLYKILWGVDKSTPPNPPTQDEFCKAYGDSLKSTDLYVKRIAGKKLYLPLSAYDHFAESLAKYVVSLDWGTISSATSP